MSYMDIIIHRGFFVKAVRDTMRKLTDICPGSRAVYDLLHLHRNYHLWVIPIRAKDAQKHGSIMICGIIGVECGVQITGTSDPLFSCGEKIDSSCAYQLIEEGVSLNLVQMYGKSFSTEPASSAKKANGCSFLYHGIMLCFACLPLELPDAKGISAISRLKK